MAWDSVKPGVVTPGQPLKNAKANGGGGGGSGGRVGGDGGERKASSSEKDSSPEDPNSNPPSWKNPKGAGADADRAVQDVHERVAALMQMAEDVLPIDQEPPTPAGVVKKGLREQLSDSWNNQGYYAKLAAQMMTPPAKSARPAAVPAAVSAAVPAAAAKNPAAAAAKKVTIVEEPAAAAAGAAKPSRAARAASRATLATASSLAKTRQKSGDANDPNKASCRTPAKEQRRMSVGKPSEAAKTPGLKQRIESGVPGFSKTPGLKQRIEALGSKTPGGTWTMAKDNALFNSSPSECGDTPPAFGSTSVAPPFRAAAVAANDRETAVLRADLAMTKSDLESTREELESLKADLAFGGSEGESWAKIAESRAEQLRAKEAECAALREEMAALKRNARRAVGDVAAAMKAMLEQGLDGVAMVEAEALETLASSSKK
jgi:hypothetical protein